MKMRMMIAVSILALAICASPARATLLAYEGFDYSPASFLNGLNGGTGFADAWDAGAASPATIVTGAGAGSLNYVGNPNAVTGGHVNVLPVNHIIQRELSSSLAIGSGETWYVSILADYAAAETWWSMNMASGAAGWAGDVTTRACFVGTGGPGARNWFGYGANSGASFDGGYTSGVVMAVMRIFGDTETNAFIIDYNWYISPEAVPTSEPGSWAATVSDVHNGWDPNPISYVRLEHGNATDGSTVDEIRIGTTWADVVVPEPVTLTLLGLGSVLLVLKRRRRA